jgi:hypothetical protein
MAQEIQKQETGDAAVPHYWDPFAAMRAEMNRVFDSFLVCDRRRSREGGVLFGAHRKVH